MGSTGADSARLNSESDIQDIETKSYRQEPVSIISLNSESDIQDIETPRNRSGRFVAQQG